MTLSNILAVVSTLIAVAALLRARAAVRRIERLSESYWELRYENGQLKARVTRLEVETKLRDPSPEAQPQQSTAATTFVPLSSLKK